MVFLERLLVLMGLSVVLAAVYVAWLANPSFSPQRKGAAFASRFLTDLSRADWNPTAVHDRVDNPTTLRDVEGYGRLGEFHYLTDFSERSYLVTPMRGITTYAFNGRFSNGRAMVQMLVQSTDAGMAVRGLYLTPIGRIDEPDAAQISALEPMAEPAR